ncbi:MAG: hypothetical protein ACHP84_13130 [Caulobacterales bacterium]
MSALARQIRVTTPAAEAVIVGAEVAAGHDGTADLVISVRHENGVVSQVVLDGETGLAVMQACGAADLAGLTGRPWRDISKGL